MSEENEQQPSVDGLTRVTLQYSVALQDVPREVYRMIQDVAQQCASTAKDLQDASATLLGETQKLGEVLRQNAVTRETLKEICFRLDDQDAILYSYYKAMLAAEAASEDVPAPSQPIIEKTRAVPPSQLPSIEPNIRLTEREPELSEIDVYEINSGEDLSND
tara:strand:+ start:226 stop:711 length:486 start_codon:yes stop_codon:yes gene_type:complete